MTNNQRFAAELAVLLTLGAVILANADPKPQDKPEQEPPRVVRAERFELVDGTGRVHGGFQIERGTSGPMFYMLADKGHTGVTITANRGGRLILRDERDKGGVYLAARRSDFERDSRPALSFQYAGQTSAELSDAALSLRKEGSRIDITLDAEGQPRTTFTARDGTKQILK